MGCKKYQNMIRDVLYREAGEKEQQEFENHIDSCQKCKKEYEEMKYAVRLVEKRIRPEREEFYWNNFWNKLEPEIKNKKIFWERIFEGFISFQKPVTQAGAALVLVFLGLMMGKFIYKNQPVNNQKNIVQQQPQIINTSFQQRTDRYLERSKILLLGLANFDPADGIENINLKHQKEISQELVKEAADLKKEFNKHSQKPLQKLINDLEVILLQIANIESEHDIEGIDMVKKGVDIKGIFLKININEMRNINSSPNSKFLKSDKNKKNI